MTIEDAARLLREGGVVAFPTETVYGLGANALDASAVRRVYELKGRPSTSPLIVHVSSVAMARGLSSAWPAAAEELAAQYWPGPLTLVVPKIAAIPDEVTAGLNTVGIRMPRHPVALQLIEAAGVPLAAPSANKFTQVSPTTAAHVRTAFGDQVPVVDGGPCEVGIESTVVAVAADGTVRLLRPGMIRLPEALLEPHEEHGGPHASPGMHRKHYSPKHARVVIVKSGEDPPADAAYVWRTRDSADAMISIEMPSDPDAYAARIYSVLHEMDARGVGLIAIEEPPAGPDWDALRDRLTRSAEA
jgi:L-threonylcarbamoyladenylate synthase